MYRSKQLVALLTFLLLISAGCKITKSTLNSLLGNKEDVQPTKTETSITIVEKYVPFTEEIKLSMEKNKIDITKIHFFLKKGLVLRGEIGSAKKQVKVGNVIEENGKKIHQVIYKDQTQGLCKSVEGRQINISFDGEKNTLIFYPNEKNIYAFKIVPNGKTYIRYQKEVYEVSYYDNNYKTEAILMIKESDAEDIKKGKLPAG